jgi:O-antigen ligase
VEGLTNKLLDIREPAPDYTRRYAGKISGNQHSRGADVERAQDSRAAATSDTATGGAAPRDDLSGAFFWLTAFCFIYCARPEDWIPLVGYLPLAKISGLFALIGLFISLGRSKRRLRDLPREAIYLLLLVGILFLSAVFSPIWRGGALSRTIDFSKVCVAWLLTFMLVTSMMRLRRIIFIQTISVVIITAASIIKGHSQPRLEGVIGGIYSNPNDLAFAIVLSLPFALAFLISAKGMFVKAAWAFGMLIMAVALLMTASRAGFITLVISGAVCLWHFGIRGRRLYLIAAVVFIGSVLLLTLGHQLKNRLMTLTGETPTADVRSAYGSFEARQFLIRKAVEGIIHYPLLGVGVRQFEVYSTIWHEVHMTYLQIAVEGGIAALVLYVMFFRRGFSNLRQLRRRRDLDPETRLFIGALHSSMVGFVVGACFAPEAYQFFPYFTVAYTSALLKLIQEQDHASRKPVLRPIPGERNSTEVLPRSLVRS